LLQVENVHRVWNLKRFHFFHLQKFSGLYLQEFLERSADFPVSTSNIFLGDFGIM
jgi:hypothetical protein